MISTFSNWWHIFNPFQLARGKICYEFCASPTNINRWKILHICDRFHVNWYQIFNPFQFGRGKICYQFKRNSNLWQIFNLFLHPPVINWYLLTRIDVKFSTPSNLPGGRFVINLRETQTYVKFVTFSNEHALW